MPEGSIAEHLEHYLQCKATAPHSTSACILVPARFRTSYKRRLLKGMQLIMQTSLRGVMWHVYYDSAAPQLLAARACRTDSSLLMSFQCIASGIPACVLVDTGASDAYVSSAFVERCGFRVEPSQATITMADGTVTTVMGTCHIRMRLGQYNSLLRFYVAELSDDWDLILGQSWLRPHSAVIDYSSNTITFWKARKRYKLTSSHIQRDSGITGTPSFLSVAQIKRAVRKGSRTFLVHVTTVPDPASSTPIDPDI